MFKEGMPAVRGCGIKPSKEAHSALVVCDILYYGMHIMEAVREACYAVVGMLNMSFSAFLCLVKLLVHHLHCHEARVYYVCLCVCQSDIVSVMTFHSRLSARPSASLYICMIICIFS